MVKFKGLRAGGLLAKSEGLRTRSAGGRRRLMVQLGSRAEREQIQPFLFSRGLNGLDDTHTGEGHLLCLIYPFKCSSLLKTPSRTHPEIRFNQLPRPLVQSSGLIKSTITVGHGFSPQVSEIKVRQCPPYTIAKCKPANTYVLWHFQNKVPSLACPLVSTRSCFSVYGSNACHTRYKLSGYNLQMIFKGYM